MDPLKIARFVWNAQCKPAVLRHFRLFPAAMPYPAGNMQGQDRAGLPPKIFAGNKKSLFLGALKFRKTEKSPKNKKDPTWVGCVVRGGGGFPSGGRLVGWDRPIGSDRPKPGGLQRYCSRLGRAETSKNGKNCNRFVIKRHSRGKNRATVAVL